MTEFALVFGDPESIERARRKAQKSSRHAKMLATFGAGPDGAVCGDCKQFVRWRYANTYFKCTVAGVSHGTATDWRVRWTACGKFEAKQ